MKKKIVKKKAPKKIDKQAMVDYSNQVMADLRVKKAQEPEVAKAHLTTHELRRIFSISWRDMLDKMIAFGPNIESTPEEFMQGCVHAADIYIRNLWGTHYDY